MSELLFKSQSLSEISIDKSEKNITEFSGYASVYNKIDDHNDIIIKGAFRDSIIKNNQIKLLWQHQSDKPLGNIIFMKEDDHGLFIKGQIINDVQYAKDAIALINNNVIDGLSIGCAPKEFEHDNQGTRILKKIDLKEISIVTFPANSDSRIDKETIINKNKEDNYMITKNFTTNPITYHQASYKSGDIEKMNELIKSSGMNTIEIKSLNSFTEGEGPELIRQDLHRQIISNMATISPIRSIASVQHISGSYIDFVIEDGEFESGWVGEIAERKDTTNSKLIQKRISVHEIYAQPKATLKLIEDSETNFNHWLVEQISDSFTKKENESFILGDGENKPKGILKDEKIKKITASEQGKIAVKDLLSLVNSLDEHYINNASFLMNRSTLAIIQNLQDSNGRFIWQPSISEKMTDTLFGIPIYCCSYMPKLEKDAMPIIFGDFKSGYKVLDRKNMKITKDPYTDKPFIKFYSVKRVGGDVLDAKALRILKS
jgi:HK97 family phage major capsid protein